jgi:hypothetical protein
MVACLENHNDNENAPPIGAVVGLAIGDGVAAHACIRFSWLVSSSFVIYRRQLYYDAARLSVGPGRDLVVANQREGFVARERDSGDWPIEILVMPASLIRSFRRFLKASSRWRFFQGLQSSNSALNTKTENLRLCPN